VPSARADGHALSHRSKRKRDALPQLVVPYQDLGRATPHPKCRPIGSATGKIIRVFDSEHDVMRTSQRNRERPQAKRSHPPAGVFLHGQARLQLHNDGIETADAPGELDASQKSGPGQVPVSSRDRVGSEDLNRVAFPEQSHDLFAQGHGAGSVGRRERADDEDLAVRRWRSHISTSSDLSMASSTNGHV
jgi:hypothetical protein